MNEPLSEEQLRIAEIGASHETDMLCAEIRQLQARHEKYEKALRLGAVTMRKARKTIEQYETAAREAIHLINRGAPYLAKTVLSVPVEKS